MFVNQLSMKNEQPIQEEELLTHVATDKIRQAASSQETGDKGPVAVAKKQQRMLDRMRDLVAGVERQEGKSLSDEEKERLVLVRSALDLLSTEKGLLFKRKDPDASIKAVLEFDYKNVMNFEELKNHREIKAFVEEAIKENNERVIRESLIATIQVYAGEDVEEKQMEKTVLEIIKRSDVDPVYFKEHWKRILYSDELVNTILESIINRFENEQIQEFFQEIFADLDPENALSSLMEHALLIKTIESKEFWTAINTMIQYLFLRNLQQFDQFNTLVGSLKDQKPSKEQEEEIRDAILSLSKISSYRFKENRDSAANKLWPKQGTELNAHLAVMSLYDNFKKRNQVYIEAAQSFPELKDLISRHVKALSLRVKKLSKGSYSSHFYAERWQKGAKEMVEQIKEVDVAA